MARAARLRPLGEARAAATLHMLTTLESFLWLRHKYGPSLRQTRETLAELARTVGHAAIVVPWPPRSVPLRDEFCGVRAV